MRLGSQAGLVPPLAAPTAREAAVHHSGDISAVGQCQGSFPSTCLCGCLVGPPATINPGSLPLQRDLGKTSLTSFHGPRAHCSPIWSVSLSRDLLLLVGFFYLSCKCLYSSEIGQKHRGLSDLFSAVLTAVRKQDEAGHH